MMGKMENVLRLPLVPLTREHEAPLRAALAGVEALSA